MTCIVGLVHKGKVFLGGDSCGSDGWVSRSQADSKVFVNGPCVIGYTTSFRFGDLLQHSFVIPEHPDDMDTAKYMRTLFIDALRDCLKEKGYATVASNTEKGGNCLVGYNGQLFEIQNDFSILQPIDGYSACGCGLTVALGSLYTSAYYIKDPRRRLLLALEASAALNSGVKAPFTLVSC